MLMISRMLASSSPGSRFGIPEKPAADGRVRVHVSRAALPDAAIQRWSDGALHGPRVAAL